MSTTTQPKRFDITRCENRRGGRSEWVGTINAPDKETAELWAMAEFECSPAHILTASLAEDEETTQSEAKHTPGPWHADGCDIIDPKSGKTIAEVLGGSGDCFGSDEWNAEARANRDVIQAAPELLEALESLLSTAVVVDVSNKARPEIHAAGFHPVLFANARAAIAKARGERQ